MKRLVRRWVRRWIVPGAALVAVAAAAAVLWRWPPLGLALRVAFVLAGAGPIGAVLLLAIARLTGADWPSVAPAARGLGWFVPLGALAMLGATGVALPPQLAVWSHPILVGIRAAVAVAALAWAGGRLRAGAGPTFAGVTLAIYAVVVTPIAADWLLSMAPGHPVSAIGMMLFLVQFAAGCATALALLPPGATTRSGRDLALLLVAAAIGLCYLAFMDYLIVWFGNLPARVPFYQQRGGWLPLAALAIGGGGTVAAVVAGRPIPAVLAAGMGLCLFVIWWVGGGPVAALLAIAMTAGLIALNRCWAHG